MTDAAIETNPPATVRVWDPLVRIGHWVLAGAFLTAYFSGDEFQDIHVIAGYTAAAVVVIRIAWGFVGSRHARFSSFVRGPDAVLGYLRGLFTGGAKRHVGHNPAGAAMILALLLGVGGTAISGMALLAAEEGKGPLAGIVSAEPVRDRAAPIAGQQSAPGEDGEVKRSDDDRERDRTGDTGEIGEHRDEADEVGEGEGGEAFESIHKAFVYFTLTLIGLHVAGVIASGVVHRENLVRAMVTGRKRAEDKS